MSKPYSEIPHFIDRINRMEGFGKNRVFSRLPGGIVGGSQKVLLAARKTVRILTKIVVFTQGAVVTSPGGGAGGSTADTTNLILVDNGGTPTARATLPFLVPNHLLGIIQSPGRAQQANNDRTIVWEPLKPLVIPEGWRLDVITDSTSTVNVFCYGFEMEVNDFRRLGYNCANDSGASPSDRLWIQTGAIANVDTQQTLVTAKAQKQVMISDIVVRIQPNVITTFDSMTLVEVDTSGTLGGDKNIFKWTCSAVTGEPVDHIIRGPIYLTKGNGLKVTYTSGVGASPSGTGQTPRGTIIVLGEFLEPNQCPQNFFYAQSTPRVPTPSDAGATAISVFSTTLVAAPAKGRCHVVEGIDVSVGGGTVNASVVGNVLAITTGTADTGAAATAIGATSVLLTPAFLAGSACQQTNFTIDRVAMECPEATAIRFESQAILSTPTAGQDVADLSATVWGRTIETTRAAADTAMFQGSTA